ncbi:MAG: S8 family peptidase, partial [Methanosarcinales archaeon]
MTAAHVRIIQCGDEHSEKITTALEEEMAQIKQREEKIPIIVVLEEEIWMREDAIRAISKERDSGVQALKARVTKAQEPLVETLRESGGARDVKQLWIANSIALKATPELIKRLSERDDVRLIEKDHPLHITSSTVAQSNSTWGIKKIDADAVWDLGLNGSGITVAVIDTGVDANHSDLDDLDDDPHTNDPKVIGWKDYVNGNATPYDDHGHGTHVSGIISGTGADGTQTGVAPGTRLLVAKAFDSTGRGNLSDSIAAFGWAVENGADIISYSAGGGNCSNSGAAWENTINTAISAGVTVIAAAGNYAEGIDEIISPACLNKSIAVGATDQNDEIAEFSIRGPVTCNGSTYTKPDVSAPGVSITSTIPGWYGSSYGVLSGTSMATPHVSGTVALMLEADNSLTPQDIREILEETAIDLGTPGKDNTYGSGRIDAYAAVLSIARVVITDYTITPNPANTDPFINATATSSRNITYAEYYITTDPGRHNATPLNATDGRFDETIENLSAAINTTALADGVYQVFMRAENSVGVWSETYQKSLSIDKTPPMITTNPVGYPDGQSAAKRGERITLNISATDNLSDVRNASVNASQLNSSIGEVLLSNNSGFWTNSSVVVNASDGRYNLSLIAYDNAGNLNGTEHLTVLVDNTPPSILNLSLQPVIARVNESVNITAEMSDNTCLNTSNTSLSIEYPDGFTDIPMMTKNGEIYYYNFTNTSVYWRYNVTIRAGDCAGNINERETWFIVARSYASNLSIDTAAEVNASGIVDVALEILTDQGVNGTIEIKKMADLTPAMNRSFELTPLGKYFNVTASRNIRDNLSWIRLNFYYTQAELDASDLDEMTLKISWYNDSLDRWERLTLGSPEWVHGTGIEP